MAPELCRSSFGCRPKCFVKAEGFTGFSCLPARCLRPLPRRRMKEPPAATDMPEPVGGACMAIMASLTINSSF